MKLSHYVFNLLSRLGNATQMFLGSEASARMRLPWVTVDQRDGFEVALLPCESSTDPIVLSSLRPTEGGSPAGASAPGPISSPS